MFKFLESPTPWRASTAVFFGMLMFLAAYGWRSADWDKAVQDRAVMVKWAVEMGKANAGNRPVIEVPLAQIGITVTWPTPEPTPVAKAEKPKAKK